MIVNCHHLINILYRNELKSEKTQESSFDPFILQK
jgi:hypothetical protein